MKTLYIMCGAPASGKTWFAKNKLCNGPGWYYVSRDEVRFSLLKDGDEYFSREDEVFDLFISKIVRGFYEEGVYNIDHTFVDDSLRGQGIGSKLVEEAVSTIKEKGAKVQATCPFASKWLEENM